MTESRQEETRCGFVAVLGAPNAGKSTLVNALVGTKVSIVSPKVQTTRTIVRGIAMFGHAQVIAPVMIAEGDTGDVGAIKRDFLKAVDDGARRFRRRQQPVLLHVGAG